MFNVMLPDSGQLKAVAVVSKIANTIVSCCLG